jgi:hypothetical protein
MSKLKVILDQSEVDAMNEFSNPIFFYRTLGAFFYLTRSISMTNSSLIPSLWRVRIRRYIRCNTRNIDGCYYFKG